MKYKCRFCGGDSTGMIQLEKLKIYSCRDWVCKRRSHLIIKILLNDLSDKTILRLIRQIPERELYVGENVPKINSNSRKR